MKLEIVKDEDGAYFVDVFRSRVGEGAEWHDYYYHNLGDSLTLNGPVKPTEKIAFVESGLYCLSYIKEKFAREGSGDCLATFAQQARHYVAPLISTQWNQRAPYNNLCPIYNNSNGSSSGQRGLTGCVATTLAQIIAYYRYPAKTTAAIPAYSFMSGGKDIRVDGVAAGTAIDCLHYRT